MSFVFHPEALAEFQDAARRYSLSQAGLGLRFVALLAAQWGRGRRGSRSWLVVVNFWTGIG